MTTPHADDELAPLDPHASATALVEARAGLLAAARGLRRAWVRLSLLALLPVAATTVLFATALFTSPGVALLWSLLLITTVGNLVRFLPQDSDGRGLVLDLEDTRRLRQALDPHAPTWVTQVNLVPEPTVHVQEDRLSLGMPLLACLGTEDLHRLVAVAIRAAAVAEEDRVVRRALELAEGRVGRPPLAWLPSYTRQHGPMAAFTAALTEFETAHDRWTAAFRANAEISSRDDARAMRHQDLVLEGWELMRREWIEPSLARGCWHRAPFSSLHQFLLGLQAAGLLDGTLPPRPGRGALVDLVRIHEDEVGDILLGERRADDLRTIGWSEHPAMVTIPTWRSIVGEALDVSRQLTGRSVAPTVAGVLELIESDHLAAVAQQIAPNHGIEEGVVGWATMSRWVGGYSTLLLTAVVGMAAIDSGRFRTEWRWPNGTTLIEARGWILPLHRIADEVLWPQNGRTVPPLIELELALGELGIDVSEALWLTHDVARTTTPERPTGSFVAYDGFGSRQVIVTDKALHVFGRPWSSGLRHHYAARMRGADELRTRMLRVWQGDEADQTAYIPASLIADARFSLLTGGARWRLVLRGEEGRFTLRGFGDGRVEEGLLAGLLDDRLTTTWLHSSPQVLRVRNVIGRIGLGLGLPTIVVAVLLAIIDPVGMASTIPVTAAVLGLVALGVAVVPDLMLELLWRLRGPTPRPSRPEPVRRYARVPTRVEPVGPEPREGARGSAMEAITLDLGDLPSLSDWEDDTGLDLADLEALPDLPDWPEHISDLPSDLGSGPRHQSN